MFYRTLVKLLCEVACPLIRALVVAQIFKNGRDYNDELTATGDFLRRKIRRWF